MHFTVIVIGENPEEQMAPFEMYEADGTEGIAINVDITEDFNKILNEELAELQKNIKQSEIYKTTLNALESFDINDGMYSILQNKLSTIENENLYPKALEYASDYYGYNLVTDENNLTDEDEFGYVVVDDKGVVSKVIDITNPNGKWDWYVVGGRWDGFFLLKDGSYVNSAIKGDIDFETIRNNTAIEAEEEWNEYRKISPDGWESYRNIYKISNNADIARKIYFSQKSIKDLQKAGKNVHMSLDIIGTMSKQEYIDYRMSSSCMPYSILYNGEFYEPEKFEITKEESEKYWDIISGLDDNTLLTLIDYHS